MFHFDQNIGPYVVEHEGKLTPNNDRSVTDHSQTDHDSLGSTRLRAVA